jgi:hypothetical protein
VIGIDWKVHDAIRLFTDGGRTRSPTASTDCTVVVNGGACNERFSIGLTLVVALDHAQVGLYVHHVYRDVDEGQLPVLITGHLKFVITVETAYGPHETDCGTLSFGHDAVITAVGGSVGCVAQTPVFRARLHSGLMARGTLSVKGVVRPVTTSTDDSTQCLPPILPTPPVARVMYSLPKLPAPATFAPPPHSRDASAWAVRNARP